MKVDLLLLDIERRQHRKPVFKYISRYVSQSVQQWKRRELFVHTEHSIVEQLKYISQMSLSLKIPVMGTLSLHGFRDRPSQMFVFGR